MSEETPGQKVVRSQGLCGELLNNGRDICILVPGHAEPHPCAPETAEEYLLAWNMFEQFPDDMPRWAMRRQISAAVAARRQDADTPTR